jgi:hypothetical protein
MTEFSMTWRREEGEIVFWREVGIEGRRSGECIDGHLVKINGQVNLTIIIHVQTLQ